MQDNVYINHKASHSQEIMQLVASIRLFVSFHFASCNYPHVWNIGGSLPVQGIGLCVCYQRAYTDNLSDAVNQLLIYTSKALSGNEFIMACGVH